MKEEQLDSNQNGQDIEIVDIDNSRTSDKKTSVHSSLTPRFSPRQRRIQVTITVSIVALVVLIIMGSNVPIRSKLMQAVVPLTPTPIAPIVPGEDNFYASGNVGWGRLFLDGKLVSHVPSAYSNTGIPDAPIHLARGTHTLLWRADPFPPKTCTISVPNNYQTDTCTYDNFVSGKQGSAWSFNFPADITALPVVPRESLIAAAQTAMQSYVANDVVQPGEIYTTDAVSKQQAIAQEPLKATLHYELDTVLNTNASLHVACAPFNFAGEQGCVVGTQDCRSFCTASTYFNVNATSTRTWDVFVATRSVWEYTTLAGKPVVQHQVDRVNAISIIEHLLPLQISWDGTQWRVKSAFSLISGGLLQSFTSPACDLASLSIPVPVDAAQAEANWNFIATPNTAAGCLGIVLFNQSQTGQSAQSPAFCLYRFGVFLAANDVAHKYWPLMPLADTHEKQLAQELAAMYKKTTGN